MQVMKAFLHREFHVPLRGPHARIEDVGDAGAKFDGRHREPKALVHERADLGHRARAIRRARGARRIGAALQHAPIALRAVDRRRGHGGGEFKAAKADGVGRGEQLRRDDDTEFRRHGAEFEVLPGDEGGRRAAVDQLAKAAEHEIVTVGARDHASA